MLLLGFEVCGTFMILWWCVPFYRVLLAGNFYGVPSHVKWGIVVAVILIQICYWLRYLHAAPAVLPRCVFLGHLALFLSRLNFIFSGGVFSAIFFARYEEVAFSAIGFALLFGILFSMFCVTRDFERIGNALIEGEISSTPSK
ncbi:hypothetical protein [Haloferula sp. BvORR071]|uniref:hypothetical protein n=1 Tax=Haloferula sp. BvORR071 TaxID=1396141 RepID=UPI0006972A5A|nr:hypothetical protein [Haloferula sp. BvORR071]